MPASRRRFEPQRARCMGDEGVSEVVGQILMFGILSMVLILSLLSFNVAKETAEERVLGTTSDSIAQRISSLVVSTSLFAENFRDMDPSIESRLELPDTIENREYDIELTGSRIIVTVPESGRSGTAPLFSAGSATFVHICAQDPFEGGSVRIRVVADESPGADPVEAPSTCLAPPETELYVYLEPAP